jgi:hypothetical protein
MKCSGRSHVVHLQFEFTDIFQERCVYFGDKRSQSEKIRRDPVKDFGRFQGMLG